MAKKPTPAPAAQPDNTDAVVQGAQNADGSAKEATTGNAPADPLAAAITHAFVPKLAKILTLPLLKLKEGEPVYIKFTGKTFIGKHIDEELKKMEENQKAIAEGKAPPNQVKEPPVMANVINLVTGEMVQIMLGKVLNGILADEYPNDAYVGKGFMIQLTEKKRGRSGGNYNTYKVAELDLSA